MVWPTHLAPSMASNVPGLTMPWTAREKNSIGLSGIPIKEAADFDKRFIVNISDKII